MGADQSPGLHQGPPKDASGAQAPEAVEIKPVLFSPETARKLTEDGATLFIPPVRSIFEMQADGLDLIEWKPNPWSDDYSPSDDVLLGSRYWTGHTRSVKARPIQVAVYLDNRFTFGSTSYNRGPNQTGLLEEETRAMRERLGVGDVEVIQPQASELIGLLEGLKTQVMEHGDEIGRKTRTLWTGSDEPDYLEPRFREYVDPTSVPVRLDVSIPKEGDLGLHLYVRRDRPGGNLVRWVVPANAADQSPQQIDSESESLGFKQRIRKLVGER